MVVAGAWVGAAQAAGLAVGGGAGAIDARRDVDAVALGERFCEARLLDDMDRVADHFAPALADLLAGRQAADVPWQSFSAPATWCTVEPMGPTDTVGVLLRVHYDSYGIKWTDLLSLERSPTSWLINNVFFERGGNLRFALFQRSTRR